MSSKHNSSREQTLADKKAIKKNYQPPPVESMKYIIVDNRFHCIYYFRLKKNFKKKVNSFKKIPEFLQRFRIIPN